MRVAWSNYIGRVQLYVTNQYVAGSSAASLLPGPGFQGTCQWVCRNFTVCGAFPGDPCYTPYGPNGGAVVYTVAVVGSTGLAHVTSEYQITASTVGDPTQLVAGAPTTDIILPPGGKQTFPDFRLIKSARDFSVYACNHCRRGLCRREQRGARLGLISGHPRLRHRRQPRYDRRRFKTGHRQCTQPPLLDDLRNRTRRWKHKVDLSTHHRIDRRTSAFKGNAFNLRACHRFEQFGGEMIARTA